MMVSTGTVPTTPSIQVPTNAQQPPPPPSALLANNGEHLSLRLSLLPINLSLSPQTRLFTMNSHLYYTVCYWTSDRSRTSVLMKKHNLPPRPRDSANLHSATPRLGFIEHVVWNILTDKHNMKYNQHLALPCTNCVCLSQDHKVNQCHDAPISIFSSVSAKSPIVLTYIIRKVINRTSF